MHLLGSFLGPISCEKASCSTLAAGLSFQAEGGVDLAPKIACLRSRVVALVAFLMSNAWHSTLLVVCTCVLAATGTQLTTPWTPKYVQG